MGVLSYQLSTTGSVAALESLGFRTGPPILKPGTLGEQPKERNLDPPNTPFYQLV